VARIHSDQTYHSGNGGQEGSTHGPAGHDTHRFLRQFAAEDKVGQNRQQGKQWDQDYGISHRIFS
jgi:hypothetical protein